MGSGGQFEFGIFGGPCSSIFCYVQIGRYTGMLCQSEAKLEGLRQSIYLA
jgi:hypothetical protein